MQKVKEKKDLCDAQISLRCTQRYKNKIKRLAAKEGVQQKEFIMDCIDNSGKMKTKTTKKEINIAACACEVQALANYLKRNYKNDSYIEEVCNKLWDLVN